MSVVTLRYEPSGLWVEFSFPVLKERIATDPVADPVERVVAAVGTLSLAPSEMQKLLRLKHRPTFRTNYFRPAVELGMVEMTLPEKPSSRLQRYRLTDAGKLKLAEIRKRQQSA